jgi:glucose/mannose-6-phosphate isomerase
MHKFFILQDRTLFMDFSGLMEELDKGDMISLIRGIPEHIRDAWEIGKKFEIPGSFFDAKFLNILVIGMGGSGMGGMLLKGMLEGKCRIPVVVYNSYLPPAFVSENTLVFAVSYSGNTEETLSCMKCAESAGARIIGITSGGELERLCKSIKIPGGKMPRTMLSYTFIPMLCVLEKLRIIKLENTAEDISRLLEKNMEKFENLGKEIAAELKGKIPVVHSTSPYEAVAYRWHTQFSENSKVFSAYGFIPEMNHNGINIEPDGGFAFVFLRNSAESENIRKRMEITKSVFSKYGKIIEVQCHGSTFLDVAFSGIIIGDFVSYYLALLAGKDPNRMDRIDWLKKELKK